MKQLFSTASLGIMRALLVTVAFATRACVAACDSPPPDAVAAAMTDELGWSVADCQQGSLNHDRFVDFAFTLSSSDQSQMKVVVVLANSNRTFTRAAMTDEWSANARPMTVALIRGSEVVLNSNGPAGACSHESIDYHFRLRNGSFVLTTEKAVTYYSGCSSLAQTTSESGRLVDYSAGAITYWRRQGTKRRQERLSFVVPSALGLSGFSIEQQGLDSPTDRALRGYIDDHFKLRFAN